MRVISLSVCAVMASLAFSPLGALAAASDQQQVVDGATSAVLQMRQARGFTRSGVLARAKAALIVPHALRGAVGIGLQGGRALLVENKGGRWSDPAFYTVGGVSIGPQIGGEATTSVLLIMTDRALDKLLQPSNATAGAQATLTAARFDANRVAQLGGADVIIWSSSEGAFAGANVDLTGFTQDSAANRAYYGSPSDASAVFDRPVGSVADARLRAAL